MLAMLNFTISVYARVHNGDDFSNPMLAESEPIASDADRPVPNQTISMASDLRKICRILESSDEFGIIGGNRIVRCRRKNQKIIFFQISFSLPLIFRNIPNSDNFPKYTEFQQHSEMYLKISQQNCQSDWAPSISWANRSLIGLRTSVKVSNSRIFSKVCLSCGCLAREPFSISITADDTQRKNQQNRKFWVSKHAHPQTNDVHWAD